jgi:hypothetical protein
VQHLQQTLPVVNLCYLVFLISGVQQNFAFLEEQYSSIARQVSKQLLKAIIEAH